MRLILAKSAPGSPRRTRFRPKPRPIPAPKCQTSPEIVPEPQPANPDILAWAAEHLDFSPDPRQAEVLTSGTNRLILCCTRQWGKSTITAIKALHLALTRPGAEILVVSRSERQSKEWLRKLKTFVLRLRLPIKGDGVNHASWLAPNGSRIIALPANADTSVGFSSVALFIVDEASRVPDLVYTAILGGLVRSNGAVWLMSTPLGQRGFFYEEWSHLDRPWTRIRATAEDCPAIAAETLASLRRSMGDEWYRQEFFCEFLPTSGALLTRAIIDAALDPTIIPLFGGRRP